MSTPKINKQDKIIDLLQEMLGVLHKIQKEVSRTQSKKDLIKGNE
jgi:hypothetical protein|tara:strand:- start:1598 stop:1732 length:135 start_codon:yes stop_codon:yes gene_type:complete